MFKGSKIVVDEMLHDVAVFLRLFGVPVVYIKGLGDDEVLSMLNRGDVLITRDRALSQKAKRKGVEVFTPPNDLISSLVGIFKFLGIQPTLKSLCSVCGGRLERVSKESVKGLIPEKVFKAKEVFWRCASCGKIYWKGGHWNNILKIYAAVCERIYGETR